MTDGLGTWLLRGIATGAGAMLAGVIVAVAFVGAISGGADAGWADRAESTAILFTLFWALAAAGSAAVGAFQAAERGAPTHGAVRVAGVLGPAIIIVVATVWGLSGGGTASPGAVLAEGVVELAGAVAGAAALARRLEPGW